MKPPFGQRAQGEMPLLPGSKSARRGSRTPSAKLTFNHQASRLFVIQPTEIPVGRFAKPRHSQFGSALDVNALHRSSNISRTLLPNADIANGLVRIAIPGSRWPLPIAAFSA